MHEMLIRLLPNNKHNNNSNKMLAMHQKLHKLHQHHNMLIMPDRILLQPIYNNL